MAGDCSYKYLLDEG
jgi:acyl-coenzyme A thioesterase 9